MIPDSEWLIVIDMQRAFGTPGSVWNAPGFHEIAPRIERLAASYGDRAILTRYVPPDPIEGMWQSYFATFPSMRLPPDDPAWDIVIAQPPGARVETRATSTTAGSRNSESASVRISRGIVAENISV